MAGKVSTIANAITFCLAVLNLSMTSSADEV
jgi:hypothetical protein